VRLMTIHQAKGLEFPVVMVPDLQREPNRKENVAFILDRHKGLSVRLPDGRGRSVKGALFNELQQRNRWREEFESMRLLYVAATRAEDRLIFSGAVENKKLENITKTESELWLAWIWQALGLEAHSPSDVMRFGDDVHIHVTIQRDGPRAKASITPFRSKAEEHVTVDSSRSFAETFPLLRPVEAELGTGLRRFAVTQLINFQRCARQYYFERMLRTPGADERAVWNDAEAPEPPANLNATLKGAVIHRFCETYAEGDDPETRLRASFEEILAQRQSELAGRDFDIDEKEAVRALLPLAKNYLTSNVFPRVVAAQGLADQRPASEPRPPDSSAGLWSELRFRLRRRFGILTGTIDKLLLTPSANGDGVDVEIIDFKTNRFSAASGKPKTRAKAVIGITRKTAKVDLPAGQAAFDFEAVAVAEVADEIESPDSTPSLAEQIERTANDYQLQMQAYALALRELFRSDSVRINSLRATLHFIDPNVEVSLPAALLERDVCASMIDDAMTRIAVLDGTLDADRFPPLPATHCRICNYHDMCPVGQEWLRLNR